MSDADDLEAARARILALQRENVQLRRKLEQDYVDRQQDIYQEIRCNPDGTIDEVVANHCNVHVEQMTSTSWWVGITRGGVPMLHLDLSSKARVKLTARNEDFLPGGVEDYGWPKGKG